MSTAPHDTTTELHRLPLAYFGGGRVLPALVPACCIDMGLLASFQFRMEGFGEAVAVQRMRYDRAYACERIVTAHGSSDPLLRRLALMLFEIYQGGR